jgi:putative hemolysin
MKNRLTLSLVLIFLLGFGLAGCVQSTPTPTAGDGPDMANPASVYCVEQGGTLEIVTDENGAQTGICHLGESACEEWSFYRGECVPEIPPVHDDGGTGMANPASTYCLEQGGQLEIRTDETGGQYGICILPEGECEEWAFFRGECVPGVILPNEVGYSDEEYGFSLAAAPDFSLDKHANYVLYRNISEGYLLLFGFQWKNDELLPVRTGMPEGEFQPAEPAHLLGQNLPKQLLVFEGKTKVAMYGPVEVGHLRLVFYLDAPWNGGAVYGDLELTSEMQSKAETLIASFVMLNGDVPIVSPPQ